MKNFYESFEGTQGELVCGDIKCGIAVLREELRAEVLDAVFERGQESALAALPLAEQLGRCRFSPLAFENPLYNRRFNKTPSSDEDLRRVYEAGYPIKTPHAGHIWCALTTHDGIFLGFFIDGNDVLYIGDTVGITHTDTTGDNNGAGYKGGEDTATALSLALDPALVAAYGSSVYTPSEADCQAACPSVPAGVGEIAPFAFAGNGVLTELVLPEGVEVIGRHAFENCTSLVKVTLPSTLKTVDVHAFSGCTALTAITLPAGVTAVPEHAFSDCAALKSLTLLGAEVVDSYAFMGCTALAALSMPCVREIGSFAFCQCNGLAELTLPDTVEVLGFCAFQECDGLKRATLPASIREMDELIFNKCDHLKTVTLPAALADAFRTAMEDGWKGEPSEGTMRDFLKTVKIVEI